MGKVLFREGGGVVNQIKSNHLEMSQQEASKEALKERHFD